MSLVGQKESGYIDAMRFVAILSVVAAHTTIGDTYVAKIVKYFGTGGVALFF